MDVGYLVGVAKLAHSQVRNVFVVLRQGVLTRVSLNSRFNGVCEVLVVF